MSGYVAKGLSRYQIRKMAGKLREIFGVQDDLYVDVIRMLEYAMALIGVDYEVVEKSKLKQEAVTVPEENKILIREDVYYAAILNDGRARFTIMHEIAHWFLHGKARISFARSLDSIPTYCDPEWQADAFAGEFLVPCDLVDGMNVDEICERCKVSRTAAIVQTNHYKKSKPCKPA